MNQKPFRVLRKNIFLVCLCAVIALAGIVFAKVELQIIANRVDVIVAVDDINPYLYSERLKAIQKKLNKVLAFNLTDYQPIAETGFWNTNTAAALEQFRDMYYKKYRLQRYYAFSANTGTPDLNAAEGLLDREVPNPADVATAYQDSMKIKLGDPASYYGNGAQDEIRRIEKGLNGDQIDPVTGELSKTIQVYRTPTQSERIIPIQISLRYGSQYSGTMGLGTGWYVTEQSSVWFSFQKNEMILQDPNGISQKFELSNTNFYRKGDTTDGGYFQSVTLQGDMGIQGSRIIALTAAGQTMVFESAEQTGGDGLADVYQGIAESGTIFGYKIQTDTRKAQITNISSNVSGVTGGVTNYTVFTNITEGSALGKDLTGGIYADYLSQVNYSVDDDQHIGEMDQVVSKDTLRGVIQANLSDKSPGGWSVSLFTAKFVRMDTNVLVFPIVIGGTHFTTNTIYTPVYDRRRIYSFRRSASDTPNIYAGYVLSSVSNRFGARKVYTYDGYQKLIQIESFSPGGKRVDQANVFYQDAETVSNRTEGQSSLDVRDTQTSAARQPVARILAGSGSAYTSFRLAYDFGNQHLGRAVLTANGHVLERDMQYDNHFLNNIADPEMIKLYDGLLSGKSELEKGIQSIRDSIDTINRNKEDWAENPTSTNSQEKISLWGWDIFTFKKNVYRDISYWNLYIAFLTENLNDMRRDLGQVDQQIADYRAGKLFNKVVLLKKVYENNTRWAEYDYTNITIADYNLTNLEAQVRACVAVVPSGTARVSYAPGSTVYRNPLAQVFEFDYTTNQSNYSERRVYQITYPDGAAVGLVYDSKGNITTVTNELKNVYSYTYDDSGNVTKKSLADGSEWLYTYDDKFAKFLGRPTDIRQPDLTHLVMAYNARGDLVLQSLQPAGSGSPITLLRAEYDDHADKSFVKRTYDQYGSCTTYEYDSDQYLVRMTQPDGGVFTFENDVYGKPLKERKGDLVTTFIEYDAYGNHTAEGIDGVTRSTSEYDAWGQRAMTTDPMGNRIRYQFDWSGRLITVVFPTLQKVMYGYDADGNKTLESYVSDSDDQKKVIYAYDVRARMTNRTLWHGNGSTNNITYTYRYDTAGNLKLQRQEAAGPVIDGTNLTLQIQEYGHNAIGLITNVFDRASGLRTVFLHDPMGRVTNEIRIRNGITVGHMTVYDPQSRPVGYYVRRSTGPTADTSAGEVRTVSTLLYNSDRSFKKTDQYGNVSVSRFNFRNALTNLTYDVFDPGTGRNEEMVHTYDYDILGNKTREVFPDGTVQEWVYQNGSWPWKESRRRRPNDAPVWSVNAFDLDGHVVETADYAGNVWKKQYSSMGYLSSETDPEGRTVDYSRDIFGNPIQIMENKSRTRQLRYSLVGKPVEIRYDQLGISDFFYYDAQGNTVMSVPGGNTSLQSFASYDIQAHALYEKTPSGLVTTRDFDPDGNILRETFQDVSSDTGSGAIREKKFEYDAYDRITAEHFPEGIEVVHRYSSDEFGMMTETRIQGSQTNATLYDQMNRAIRSVVSDVGIGSVCDIPFYSGPGLVSGKVYDAAGLPVIEVLAGGRTVKSAFTADGKTACQTNESGEIKTVAYNAVGNMVQTTDFDGNVYAYDYDKSGKMVRSVNPDGGVTAFTLDPYGNVAKKRLPDGESWEYETDQKGRLVRETNPFGGVRSAEYNAAGLLVRETSAAGGQTEYTYGGNGTLVSISRPGSGGNPFVTHFVINAFGETNRIVNPDGGTIDYRNDGFGRTIRTIASTPAGVSSPVSYTNLYQYSPEGFLVRHTGPDGTIDATEYRSSGLVSARYMITNGVPCRETAIDYSWGGLGYGRAQKTTDWRGISEVSYYDAAGRVTNRTESVSGRGRTSVTEYGIVRNGGQFYRTQVTYKKDGDQVRDWSKSIRDFRGNAVQSWKRFNGTETLVQETEYNATGKIAAEKTFRQAGQMFTTANVYNGKGWLYSRTDPSGLVTSFEYTPAGLVYSKHAQDRVTTYDYYPNGTLRRQTDGPSTIAFGKASAGSGTGSSVRSTVFIYDFRGNAISREDEQTKAVTRTWYDVFGNRIAQAVIWSGVTNGKRWEYDSAGRVVTEVNELGGETTTAYDAIGNRTRVETGPGDTLLTLTYDYDAAGNQVQETRSGPGHNYTTRYSYDDWGSRLKTVYPDNSAETEAYDLWGGRTNTVDRYGYSSAVIYDDNGRAVRRTDRTPGGDLITVTAYDYSGNVVSEKRHPSTGSTGSGQETLIREIINQYDAAGNVARKILVGAGVNGDIVLSFGYDAWGEKTAEIDGNGGRTETEYDGLGRVIRVRDPEGRSSSITYEYGGDGRLTVSKTVNGIVTKTVTDGFGNKTATVDGNGVSEFALYNAAGKPVRTIDRNGSTNVFYYDRRGLQTAGVDPYGYSVSNVYDAFGNIVRVVDKEGNALDRDFDWAGRLVRTVDALGNVAAYSYKIGVVPAGETTSEAGTANLKCGIETFTDAEGHVSVSCTLNKQTLAFTDALGHTTAYRYDAFGNMTATVDPKGNLTRIAYDRRGNRIKETTALGFAVEYGYDNNGNQTFEKNGEATICTYYNQANDILRKEYSDGNIKLFAYDGAGRLITAADRNSSYTYQYDAAGNMVRRTDHKNSETIEYGYDRNGNRVRMTSLEKTVLYRYDALGQIVLETVTTASSGAAVTNVQVGYRYSPMGRLVEKKSQTLSSGSTQSSTVSKYEYDTIYRLTKIANYTNSTVLLNSMEYRYDRAGNRVRETTVSGGPDNAARTSEYRYDAAYRLTSALYGSDGESAYERKETFTYDAAGNRLTKTVVADKMFATNGGKTTNAIRATETTHSTYDNDNRLMLEQVSGQLTGPAVSEKSVRHVYDKAGRLVQTVDGDTKTYYKYNSRDLLVKRTEEKGGVSDVTEYEYDADNLRVSKKESSDAPGSMDGGAERFVYDGENLLRDGSAFYLNNIMVNGYEAEIQSLRTVVYIKDAMGTIRGEVADRPVTVIGGSGNADKPFSYRSFEYTAFGEQIGLEKKESVSYTGHYFDKESGLYYARARYYKPETGRFISSDPVADPEKRFSPAGLNRYIYGINNPVKYWDPNGEEFIFDDLAAAIIGGITGFVRGLFSMDLSDGFGLDDLFDPILGAATGALSGWVSYYTMQFGGGTTVDLFATTKGVSASVGWMGMTGVGVNVGFRNGGSIGLSGYAGFKLGDTGIGIGLEGGINYSSVNGLGGSAGVGVNFGSEGGIGTSGTRFGINAGVNWSQRNGYEGFYARGSMSAWDETGGSTNLASGLSFDRKNNINGVNVNAGVGYQGWSPSAGIVITGTWQAKPDFSLHFDAQQAQAWQKVRQKEEMMKDPTYRYGGMGQSNLTDETMERIATQDVIKNQEYEVAKQKAINDGTLGQFYKEQLKKYDLITIDGVQFYQAEIDGITILMSGGDFADKITGDVANWTGNTPINKAIDGINPQTLIVLVDMAHANDLDKVQVSSLWRLPLRLNDPHNFGNSVDITHAWRNNVKYDFQNTVNESQVQRDTYNWLRNDSRVRQVYDPWRMTSSHGAAMMLNTGSTPLQIEHLTHLHFGI